jgi:hypothetical protein
MLTAKLNIGLDADWAMAAVVIDAKDLIGLNSSGYARRFTLGDRFVGIAVDSQDNSAGSAGDKLIRARRGLNRIEVAVTGSSLANAERRAAVYATDHETIGLTQGQRIGYLEQHLASGKSIVVLDPDNETQVYAETIAFGDFTDNGDTTGYVDLAGTIPEGAIVQGVQIHVATGFTGDTTAVADVGKAGALEIFASDLNVLAADVVGELNGDGVYVVADTTPRVTVTGGADFGSIAAGSATVRILYTRTLQV